MRRRKSTHLMALVSSSRKDLTQPYTLPPSLPLFLLSSRFQWLSPKYDRRTSIGVVFLRITALPYTPPSLPPSFLPPGSNG